jgi:nucleoside-diphosphate-sugar epimerase
MGNPSNTEIDGSPGRASRRRTNLTGVPVLREGAVLPVTPARTVLVTGASGFIGSNLIEALVRRGDRVVGLVRETSNTARLEPLGIELCTGDVTDPQSLRAAVRGCDVVYHLAGCNAALNKRRFDEINRQGVHNIAAACASQDSPPTLIHVSSIAAAGPALAGQPRVETDPPSPVSNYGHSKLAGERALDPFADQVPITIVRPPIVLGEADRQGFELFQVIAQFRMHLMFGWGRGRYSVIHAADLATLLILAAERGQRLGSQTNGDLALLGVYFAACEIDPSYAELGRMVAVALNRRGWPVPLVPPLVWSGAAVNELVGRIRRRPLVLNFDKVREARAGSWCCPADRAVEELGFGVGAPLSERLRQTVEWYQREGWL